MQNIQNGTPGADGNGGAKNGTDSGGGTAPANPADGGFVLTGIVRLQSMALAVIRQGAKTFIVGPGMPLEKTGYTSEDNRG